MTIDSSTQLAGSHSLTTGGDTTVRANYQNTGTFTDFTYSMLFRIDSYGSGGTARAMNWTLSSTAGGSPAGDLGFKVDTSGTFAGAALLLDDTTGFGFTPTATTTYRWDIIGTDFDGVSAASFDVRIFDAGTEVFTSTGNTFATTTSDAIESVNFYRGGNWGGGGFTVDNISITAVPEPSSAALLGLGGLALILRRRK